MKTIRSRPHRFLASAVVLGAVMLSSACEKLFIRDIATDALDPSNLSDTEPSIAVNPGHPRDIAIVTFSENWTAAKGAPVWKSSDNGETWTKVFQIVQPDPTEFGPGDQKLDFDANGHIYVAELAEGAGVTDYVYRETAGPNAPLTPGAGYGNDQPHLSVDRSSGSPLKGHLYSPWLNFGLPLEQSTVANSANQGIAMNSVGAGDNSSFPNRTTRSAIAPDGEVYIIYKTREGNVGAPVGFENVHFHVNRSDDGGVTWTGLGAAGILVSGAAQVQTYFTNAFGNLAKGKVARARSSDAWIAVNHENGDVYTAYVRRDASGFAQIYVARSTDQGATWASERATDGTHNSAYPEIAVTERGVVGLLFVDYDDSGSVTLFRHQFARSFDQGSSWDDDVLQTMNPGPLANAASGFLWGDYEGLTAARNTFYGVFTGESSGRTTPQLDPIFFRRKSCRWWWVACWLGED
jgi:hypothetical protein